MANQNYIAAAFHGRIDLLDLSCDAALVVVHASRDVRSQKSSVCLSSSHATLLHNNECPTAALPPGFDHLHGLSPICDLAF
mmetsp:Transcript_32824/g.45799  ORF Transcript_32824/g.45799 Transcript_32824/m.45799 type:complete len:81 (-) Transcript_32824:2-244(-)